MIQKPTLEMILDQWKEAQQADAMIPCPRCGNYTMKGRITTNALSRRADIYICDLCGMQEAIDDMIYQGKIDKNKDLQTWFAVTQKKR